MKANDYLKDMMNRYYGMFPTPRRINKYNKMWYYVIKEIANLAIPNESVLWTMYRHALCNNITFKEANFLENFYILYRGKPSMKFMYIETDSIRHRLTKA